MKRWWKIVRLVGALTAVCLFAPIAHAQQQPTLTPTPPPPGVVLPTPTAVPTALFATHPQPLPDLQPITRANAASLQPLFTLQCRLTGMAGTGYQPAIYEVLLSPVDNRLVVVANDIICIYDLDNPAAAPITLEASRIGAESGGFFGPDGQAFYTLHNEYVIRKWDALTGEALPTELEGVYLPNVQQNLALSPDGTQLATGSRLWLRLWDMVTSTNIVSANVGRVTAVAWSSNGTRLATIEEGRPALYTLHPGPLLFRDTVLEPVGNGAGLAFGGADGNLLAYTSPEGEGVMVLNITSGEIVAAPDIDSTVQSGFYQQELVFSPVDPLLLAGTGREIFTLWNVAADQHLWDYVVNPNLLSGGPHQVAFNADGTLLVLAVGEVIAVFGVSS